MKLKIHIISFENKEIGNLYVLSAVDVTPHTNNKWATYRHYCWKWDGRELSDFLEKDYSIHINWDMVFSYKITYQLKEEEEIELEKLLNRK